MSRVFGATRQVAMVVRDIDTAITAMVDKLGIGPFFILREFAPEDYRYKGEPCPPPILSLAFAFSGDLNIELIEQHNEAPSAYRDFLNERGEGVQHFASWTSRPEEFDALRASAVAAGYTIIHEGRVGNNRFAYVDTIDPVFGMCFELAEGLTPELAPIVERMRETAQGWDGTDPIRPFA